jgi:hypothetical protein
MEDLLFVGKGYMPICEKSIVEAFGHGKKSTSCVCN